MSISGDELTEVVVKRLRESFGRIPIKVIANFCGVSAKTVGGWFDSDKPMGGLQTVKLWHLLAAAGIESPELENCRRDYDIGEYIGRLLAFGVITMAEAREFANNVHEGAIFRAIRTEGRIHKMAVTFEEFRNQHDELLSLAVEELMKQIPTADEKEEVPQPQEVVVLPEPEVTSPPDVMADPELVMVARSQLVLRVAEKLLAALAHARLATVHFTPEERHTLRTFMGEQGMFDLSNTADMLCSERSFTMKNGG